MISGCKVKFSSSLNRNDGTALPEGSSYSYTNNTQSTDSDGSSVCSKNDAVKSVIISAWAFTYDFNDYYDSSSYNENRLSKSSIRHFDITEGGIKIRNGNYNYHRYDLLKTLKRINEENYCIVSCAGIYSKEELSQCETNDDLYMILRSNNVMIIPIQPPRVLIGLEGDEDNICKSWHPCEIGTKNYPHMLKHDAHHHYYHKDLVDKSVMSSSRHSSAETALSSESISYLEDNNDIHSINEKEDKPMSLIRYKSMLSSLSSVNDTSSNEKDFTQSNLSLMLIDLLFTSDKICNTLQSVIPFMLSSFDSLLMPFFESWTSNNISDEQRLSIMIDKMSFIKNEFNSLVDWDININDIVLLCRIIPSMIDMVYNNHSDTKKTSSSSAVSSSSTSRAASKIHKKGQNTCYDILIKSNIINVPKYHHHIVKTFNKIIVLTMFIDNLDRFLNRIILHINPLNDVVRLSTPDDNLSSNQEDDVQKQKEMIKIMSYFNERILANELSSLLVSNMISIPMNLNNLKRYVSHHCLWLRYI